MISAEIKQKVIEIATEDYQKNGFFDELEFKKDIYNLFIIRKMISRFLKTGNINEKLLINNIIILINVFGVERANRLLRTVLSDNEFSVAKSILVFLDCYILYDEKVKSNRIIDDMLKDTAQRYNLRDKHV